MRAIRFDEYGDYDVLRLVDVPEPDPAPGEIVVKMAAASVNPFDNTVRRGWVPQVPAGLIQGNEGPASSSATGRRRCRPAPGSC